MRNPAIVAVFGALLFACGGQADTESAVRSPEGGAAPAAGRQLKLTYFNLEG